MSINLSKYITNSTLKVRVVPNSSRTELVEENNQLKLYLKSVPEKGKANRELVRYFRRCLKLSVEIISGKTSRNKVLRIL
ncbi:MAG: hypothetical protein CMH61_00180 [Nanoarchaeota archaeon]|nr:hypothetical protein [Nanoarchaeota archaeon]|tara:strand:- start:3914 stop:4153 length:240 start_codon:yes stop_codon:yes gene_type:complete